MKTCKQCQSPFEVADEDRKLYDQVSPVIKGKKYPIPDPVYCPDCRQQRRLAFRNEKTLYKRNCSLCKRSMVSLYDENAIFPVYCQDCFWSDKWNARDYGRDPDFNRSFFEQFTELIKTVPRLALVNKQSLNSEYCNYSFQNKNCYLIFGGHYEEDCMYGGYSTENKSCLDYFWLYKSELCYESVFSADCYHCAYLDYSEDCSNCFFGFDLKGCRYCLFCHNLRNKNYCISNKQYSKDEYEAYLEKLNLSSYKKIKSLKAQWQKYRRENAVFRDNYQTNCVNCEGNDHQNSKNLKYCFACTECEDCIYGFQMDKTYSSIDNSHTGYDKCELSCSTIGTNGIFHCLCCDSCWHDSDCYYCNLCFSSRDCFGCIGMRQDQYCILNKKYTKEEYEETASKIIEKMKTDGQWGSFFPLKSYPYSYNESVAPEYYPLNKEKALRQGWRWKASDNAEPSDHDYEIPDNIQDIDDTICGKTLFCAETGQAYKILPQELKFYKTMSIPVPRICFKQRHRNRISSRNPYKLWRRKCYKCQSDIQTSFSPDRPEKVYCEDCYLKEVY